jgi:hypothetical protein
MQAKPHRFEECGTCEGGDDRMIPFGVLPVWRIRRRYGAAMCVCFILGLASPWLAGQTTGKANSNPLEPSGILAYNSVDHAAQNLARAVTDFERKFRAGTLTADDYTDLGTGYWMVGSLTQSHDIFEAAVRKYPDAVKCKDSLKVLNGQMQAIEQYLSSIDSALHEIQKQALGAGSTPEFLANISITRSLVGFYTDVGSGRFRIAITYSENGQPKAGQVMLGRKAFMEWNDALNAAGVVLHVVQLTPGMDPNDASRLLGATKVTQWPRNLISIDAGPFKGAYRKPEKVTVNGKECFEVIIPGISFLKQGLNR